MSANNPVQVSELQGVTIKQLGGKAMTDTQIREEAYKRGFADAIHVAEEWQDGVALTPAAIRTMQWRAIERMMGRDPYRSKNGKP